MDDNYKNKKLTFFKKITGLNKKQVKNFKLKIYRRLSKFKLDIVIWGLLYNYSIESNNCNNSI